MKRFISAGLLLASFLLIAWALAQDTATDSSTEISTPTVEDDGSVTVTGITLPGQNVTLPDTCEAESDQTAKVVCTAEAFLETLSADQQAEVALDLTAENAAVWSNLPISFVPRNGIQLSTLDDTQLGAAYAVVKAAMGNAEDNGYNEAMQILMADDILNASGGMQGGGSGGPPADGSDTGGSDDEDRPEPPAGGGPGGGGDGDYSRGSYFLAFLGTPSTTDTWLLQFGGHHLAVNTTYEAGAVASATPKFTGVEPKVWTAEDVTYAPMNDERDNMVAMLGSLSDEQLAAAELSQTFDDVLLGPGADGQFPETKVGLAVSELSDEQKALVVAAMSPWVQDADDTTAEELLATYEAELDETYVAYSTDPTLSNHTAYARIDGPSVWIELIAQNGIVYSDQIHYHTIWRDHERDYGAEFSF